MSVKIRPSTGTADEDDAAKPWYRRLGFSWHHDWDSIYDAKNCNWSNFTIVTLEGEICWHMGTAEIEAALFGVHVRFTYYWANENREAMRKQVAEILGSVDSDGQ